MPHQCDTEQGNELPQNLKVAAQVMVLPIPGVLFRIIFTYKKHIFYQLLKYTSSIYKIYYPGNRENRKPFNGAFLKADQKDEGSANT